MEPSQFLGGAEECHSSESGWTRYIGSPIDDDDDDGHSDDGDYHKRDNEGTQADPEDESDDSMASDASSGPSHHGILHPWGNGEGGDGLADFQQAAEEEYDDDKYICLDKKANKTQEKQMEGKRVEKKDTVFIDSKGKAPVQGSSGKVRKNHWVGKRKK